VRLLSFLTQNYFKAPSHGQGHWIAVAIPVPPGSVETNSASRRGTGQAKQPWHRCLSVRVSVTPPRHHQSMLSFGSGPYRPSDVAYVKPSREHNFFRTDGPIAVWIA